MSSYRICSSTDPLLCEYFNSSFYNDKNYKNDSNNNNNMLIKVPNTLIASGRLTMGTLKNYQKNHKWTNNYKVKDYRYVKK